MKKTGFIFLSVILALTAFWFIKYDALERKLIVGNIGHMADWDFDSVRINEEAHTVTVTFEKDLSSDKMLEDINDTFINCSEVIRSFPEYGDHRLELVIANDKRPIFIMSDDGDGEVAHIYCSININRTEVPLSEIGERFPDIKTLHPDDLRFNKVPPRDEWSDTKKSVYAEYCNVDNYKAFTSLEHIVFCIKPDNATIAYLEESFPDCTVEWEKEIPSEQAASE